MIIKMLISFDYDPETNEYTPISQEIISEKKEPVKVEETAEPQLLLTDGKYLLNKAAVELLKVKPGDRIAIGYKPLQNSGNNVFPVIASSTVWGVDKGNKLTKSLSVSCKGTGHDILAGYGDTFSFSEFAETPGAYILVGNKELPADDNITTEVESLDDIPTDELDETPDADLDETELQDVTYDIEDLSF